MVVLFLNVEERSYKMEENNVKHVLLDWNWIYQCELKYG